MIKSIEAVMLCALSCLLASCASFRGPGPLVLGGPSASGTTPSETAIASPGADSANSGLSLNGSRGFSQSGEEIQLEWPVDTARFSRGFFASASRRKRPHWGIDLANHRGTPIYASEKGTVIYTGRAFHGYGRLIVIEHGSDWATMYGHLDKIMVKEGQTVERGEEIARMGRTGRATGVHLHFEVRHFRQPVNPLAYLPSLGSKMAGLPDANQYPLISQESRGQLQESPSRDNQRNN